MDGQHLFSDHGTNTRYADYGAHATLGGKLYWHAHEPTELLWIAGMGLQGQHRLQLEQLLDVLIQQCSRWLESQRVSSNQKWLRETYGV